MVDFSKLSALSIENDGDGNTIFDFGPESDIHKDTGHNENLAEVIDDSTLGDIAADLLRDIEEDDRSRAGWLLDREKAIGLLGMKVAPPRASVAAGGAPFDGLSTYQDGALLEACVKFQANCRGELLPASGPGKVENDGAPVEQNDQQADALEKAFNQFLTVGSPEYVPDHDRLFFQTGFSGLGVVKGYHCPLRRRPVAESIDAKDLIISADVTDIDSAARVTQRILMKHSTFIRMQIAGAYLDTDVTAPPEIEKNVVDSKLESVTGVTKTQSAKPGNNDRVLYECYADYDIPGFEHKLKGKLTGLPIPYKFTIDKASRKIIEVRRNWKEDDEQCMKRKTFVVYPFVPYFGFFPLGLMNLMGNATNGITAAFRVAIDNGMINNFPFWLYAKNGSGQDKTSFTAGPGQGIPVNVPAGGKIADMFMPVPTKNLDPAFVQIMQMVKADAQRIGGTADIQVGEGKQNAPVGTTIALLEAATKVMDSVHKRMHQAQAEEFRMLRDLLQEDPEALWRYKGKAPYNADILIEALNNYDLVPQADPNVSSHMMRVQKAEAGAQLIERTANALQWDVQGATELYCDQVGIPQLKRFIQGPAQPMPPQQPGVPGADNGARAAAMVATQRMKSQDAAQDRQLEAQKLALTAHDNQANRMQRDAEKQIDLAREILIHPLAGEAIAQPSVTNPGSAQ